MKQEENRNRQSAGRTREADTPAGPTDSDAAAPTTTPVRFPLGRTLITPAALGRLHPDDVATALLRHAAGDWGDCGPHDQRENDFSLSHGLRLFSVYHDRNETRFWVITEADRSATTVLLPEDY